MEMVVKLEDEEQPCATVQVGNIDEAPRIEMWQGWRRSTQVIKQVFSMMCSQGTRKEEYSKCKRIGLDFDVGSGRKQKLDLQLLTNGVVSELVEFAHAMTTRAQRYYIAEILEYNFPIDFQNDHQRYEFTVSTWQKVTTMQGRRLKPTPEWLRGVFTLDDPQSVQVSKPVLSQRTHNEKSELVHTGVGMKDEPGVIIIPNIKIETPIPETKTETPSTQSNCTEENLYPLCQQIGLDFDVSSKGWKAKLDFDVLTRAVMKEVFCYTKEMCATSQQIVLDVLDYNFNLDLQTGDSELSRGALYRLACLTRKMMVKKMSSYKRARLSEMIFSMRPPIRTKPSSGRTYSKRISVTNQRLKKTIFRRQLRLQKKKRKREQLAADRQMVHVSRQSPPHALPPSPSSQSTTTVSRVEIEQEHNDELKHTQKAPEELAISGQQELSEYGENLTYEGTNICTDEMDPCGPVDEASYVFTDGTDMLDEVDGVSYVY